MIALDSSVIVAALLSWHESHPAASRAVERAMAASVVIPAHALFESYAVITRLPAPYRLAPSDALTLLRGNFAKTRIAAIHSRNVWPLLEEIASDGLGGGVTYDAIIYKTAAEAGATELLTLNERDYERFAARVAIRTPRR